MGTRVRGGAGVPGGGPGAAAAPGGSETAEGRGGQTGLHVSVPAEPGHARTGGSTGTQRPQAVRLLGECSVPAVPEARCGSRSHTE